MHWLCVREKERGLEVPHRQAEDTCLGGGVMAISHL